MQGGDNPRRSSAKTLSNLGETHSDYDMILRSDVALNTSCIFGHVKLTRTLLYILANRTPEVDVAESARPNG